MNNGTAGRERELVELYQELTGASESAARGVYMHIFCREMEDDSLNGAEKSSAGSQKRVAPERRAGYAGNGEPWVGGIVPVPAAG
jgi:hypothetical protein